MDPGMVKNLAAGAIPPALIAGTYFGAMWLRLPTAEGEPEANDRRLVATPIIFAVGVVLTYWFAFGAPALSPVKSIDWLPLIALAAGVAGAVASIERAPSLLRWIPTAGVLVFAGWATLRNVLAKPGSGELAAAELLEFALAGGVALAAGVGIVRRGRIVPILVLLLFAGGACQLLVLGYFSMNVGQVVGMSASMLGAALVVALWRENFRLGAGGMVFVVLLTMAGLLQARLYGRATPEMARVYGAVILGSLLAAWIAQAGLPERLSPRMRGTVVVAAAALPLVVGLAYAGKNWMAEQEQKEKGAEEDPYASAGWNYPANPLTTDHVQALGAG